jgi:ankyrin repeat protein
MEPLILLMIAARYEREDVVAFLIKYGANIQDTSEASGNAAGRNFESIRRVIEADSVPGGPIPLASLS